MTSEPNFEYVGGFARYASCARASYEAGDTARGDAFGAVASAFQLFPPHGERGSAPRGQYFGPMATGSFGEIPDMRFIRRADTIACLRSRMERFRNPFRRARIADTVWEFAEHPDPQAARIAIDAYLAGGTVQLRSYNEFAPMMAAGALTRSLALALAMNDRERVARALAVLRDAVEELVTRDEHVALFRITEALLPRADADTLQYADYALDAHLRRLESRDEDNFHFREGIIELQIKVARRRGEIDRIRALERRFGETIAAEAAWKGSHYPNGGLVAMHFYAKAAEHFEKVGDNQRANDLRKLERASYSDADFGRVEATVEVDLAPYRERLGRILDAEGERDLLWPGLLRLLPLLTPSAIEKQRADEAGRTPLSLMGVSSVRPEGILEAVPAEEAAARRAAMFAYQQHAMHVMTVVRLALDEHGVGATAAAPVLKATGLFDGTSAELLDRLLAAMEKRDWLTAAYLAAPLFERLVRAIAVKSGIETMYTDRGGGRVRRIQVAIELLLRRIPLSEPILAYVRWTLTHPGLNVRNEAGHGLLEVDACTEALGAHMLYALLALAFGDLVMTSREPTGDSPPA